MEFEPIPSSHQNQEDQEDAINLRHYWHVILERRWLIITAFISVLTLSLVYLFKATPLFNSICRLEIGPETSGQLSTNTVVDQIGDYRGYVRTQIHLLSSRELSAAAIKRLNLSLAPSSLVNDVTVTPQPDSRVVDISVVHTDSKTAASIANTLADLYFEQILSRLNAGTNASVSRITNIRVLDRAVESLRPVKPRLLNTLLLGVAGGLAIALGLAFFVNYLDDSLKSQDDVETYLRLPFLGYIPRMFTNSVVERDLQSHLHPQSNAAEGFRTIRATISLTHKPDKFRTLAVTSTIPSEGKSLVASNLAIVTAQTGLKTLLVDVDLRRPSVHKAYQLHSPAGLSSFLTEETDQVEKIIHRTEVPNLDVICCGSVPSTPSELIGSKRMAQFLEVVRGRYDRVILDCPAISAVSDPLIIAAMSDGVVFVTKFNKIRREHARKSVQRVQNAGIHILGVVLNDIDFEGKDSYYYSYYYYQNRYYASHYKTGSGDGAKGKDKAPAMAKVRNDN
jgi:capsular exopolysaccharide synthesis family protein